MNALPRLFSFSGVIARGPYFLLGVLLFAIKYPLDHLVATYFDYPWSPFSYFMIGRGPLLHPARTPYLWLSLLAVAVPFVWIGVALTVRRLRSMGYSPAWAGLFFAPYVNYLCFAVWALIPPRQATEKSSRGAPDRERPAEEPVSSLFPRGEAQAFCVALGAGVAITVGSVLVGTRIGEVWGSSLFLVSPISIGFFTTLIQTYHNPQTLGRCIKLATCMLAAMCFALFLFALEGAPCIVMAFPILWIFVTLGAVLAYFVNKFRWDMMTSLVVAIGVIPTAMLIEADFRPESVPYCVESTIEVNASPEIVWRRVVRFPTIDEPLEWIFRLGVTAPRAAVIDGTGEGALRRCIFDQGEFEEPIEVWDAPRELTFGVNGQPPHLDSYLRVERGQFVIKPTPEGTSVIEGRTWFELDVHPVSYWSLWSDSMIETIHQRVLRHIRGLAEADAARLAVAQTP